MRKAQISYVVAIRSREHVDPWLAEVECLRPTLILNTSPVSVAIISSGVIWDFEDKTSVHSLIDDDLEQIRKVCPAIGGFRPLLGGIEIGNRWPVVTTQDDTKKLGEDVVSVEARWDNLLIHQADQPLSDSLLRLTAITLGRYRVLTWSIESCRRLLMEVQMQRQDQLLLSQSMKDLEQLRDDAMISRIVTDPRDLLYWGCEYDLVQALYDRWGMGTLEKSSSEAILSTTTVINGCQSQIAAKASRQATTALLMLTIISGMSALASLIAFATADSPLEWVLFPRGMIAVSLVCIFVALVLLLRNKTAMPLSRTTR